MAHDRTPRPGLSAMQLILCLAAGLWLGALAIAVSAWLMLQLWPQALPPVAQALAPVPAASAPASDAQQVMFERYQQNLQRQPQAATDPARNPRNLNDPKCQFWLQQDRTASTANSQAHVREFCNP